MTIEKKDLLHGIYIRISLDTGKQVGAHAEYVQELVDTSTEPPTILSRQHLDPRPLEAGAEALTPLIGEIVITQQADLARCRAALLETATALEAEMHAHATTQTTAAQAAAAERETALSAHLNTLAQHAETQAGEARLREAALTEQLDLLTQQLDMTVDAAAKQEAALTEQLGTLTRRLEQVEAEQAAAEPPEAPMAADEPVEALT